MSRPILSLNRKKPEVVTTPLIVQPIKKVKLQTPKKIKVVVPQLTAEEVAAYRVQQAELAYLWLSLHFSVLFSERNPKAPKPMALGSHKRIKELWKTESDAFRAELGYRSIKFYLEGWVNRAVYRYACSIPGSPRFDVDGQILGEVSEREAIFSRAKL